MTASAANTFVEQVRVGMLAGLLLRGGLEVVSNAVL